MFMKPEPFLSFLVKDKDIITNKGNIFKMTVQDTMYRELDLL